MRIVKWFEIQMILVVHDLRFNWFGCQLIWDSNDLVVNRCVLQMILVVCCFELQVMWLSIDLRSKWFGCQLIWDSNDLVVNRFEIQMSWLSIDLRFKWFGCQMVWGSSDLVANWCVIQMILSNEAFLRDSLQNWSFEAPKRNISARLPSKIPEDRSIHIGIYRLSRPHGHTCLTVNKNLYLSEKCGIFVGKQACKAILAAALCFWKHVRSIWHVVKAE